MGTIGFLGGIGLPELIIILLAIVLLFGATRIPQLARSLGKSVSEFKKGVKESEEPDEKEGKDSRTDQSNKT